MKRNKEEPAANDAVVAVTRRATGPGADATSTEAANITAPRARSARATHEAGAAGRTRSEAQADYWRDVKSGKRIRNEKPAEMPKAPDHNPIFDLPEAERLKLYARLRECPLTEIIQAILEEHGVPPVTNDQINEFFAVEAENLWEVRTLRAVTEANALVRFAEKTDKNIPAGILAALGQQTFKLVAEGADPAQINRLATMFIKLRSDSRADQMQGLKRRKVEHDLGDGMHAALRKLAEEVDRCPAAQEHFDALQRALAESGEDVE